MEKTLKETKESIWFRTEIPVEINTALKELARQKSRRYKKHGISYTKEGMVRAILEQAIDARKTGSIKTLASWLFDGEYVGSINEAPVDNIKSKPVKRIVSLTTV